MSEYYEVGAIDDWKDGQVRIVEANGNEVMVIRKDVSFYATDPKCPHLGGDLSKGTLEGTIITCPRHGSQFDITDGHVVRWLKGSGITSAIASKVKTPKSLVTYPVLVEEGKVFIEI